jgi:hypothetical protein
MYNDATSAVIFITIYFLAMAFVYTKTRVNV